MGIHQSCSQWAEQLPLACYKGHEMTKLIVLMNLTDCPILLWSTGYLVHPYMGVGYLNGTSHNNNTKIITTICNQRHNTAMSLEGRKKDKLDVDIHIADGPVRAHVNRWGKRHFGFMFAYHFFFKLLQCAHK